MKVLRLEGVCLGYSQRVVLRGISFSVEAGEMVGLIGPNGAGKSTLIKGISQVLPLRSGNIFLNGRSIKGFSPRALAQLISVVPQNPSLPPLFTAFEVILMGRTPWLGHFRFEGRKDIEIALEAMRITKTLPFAERKAGELSGGERQRVILARALAQEPKVLLLDEPTANLDINHQIETLSLIKDLSLKKGLAVVIAMHDLNLASQFCDKLIALHKGGIYTQGLPEEVIKPEIIKEVYETGEISILPHPVNRLPVTIITPSFLKKGAPRADRKDL